MRRTSFPRESEILGQRFDKLIGREGGKGAGLRLLHKLQEALGSQFREIASLEIPDYGVIPTIHYKRFEECLDDLFERTAPLDWYTSLENTVTRGLRAVPKKDSEAVEILSTYDYDTPPLIDRVLDATPQLRRIVKKGYNLARDRFGDSNGKFHLRSSTTIEDFVDDRYWGTFETSQGIDFFGMEQEREYRNGVYFIFTQFMQFYGIKRFSTGSLQLEDVDLALVLQRTREGKLTIAYSSYPEEKIKETKIEVARARVHYTTQGWMIMYDLNGPEFMFYRVDSKGKIVIHQGFSGKPSDKEVRFSDKYPLHQVKGQVSILPERQIKKLDRILRVFEEHLGYSVNLELMVTDTMVNVVQLRPVPRLDEKRGVKELPPLPENCLLLAETPFVYGSFRREGKIVQVPNKYTQGFQLDENYIVLHWERNKGFRWFWEDPHCQGILNPYEGMVLTHGHSLIPHFGNGREKFVFIGVPGFYDKIKKHLKPRTHEWTIPWTGDKVNGIFKYTDFMVTIESDGRHGRVYLKPECAKIYNREK